MRTRVAAVTLLGVVALESSGAAARNASLLRAPATCKLAPCWRCVGAGTAGCCRAPRPKKRAPTCECGAGGLREFEAWRGSPRQDADAPVFFLGVAKTGSESFRKDLPRHLRPGTKIAERPQERCLSAAPVNARVMTLLREPRANVRSQWHHCSQDQDGWFHPSKLPATFGAWLAHWRSGAAARAFHCYLPFNLQTRVLSCKSADPCLPFATPALDTTVLADRDGSFVPDLGLALRRVLAPESEGGLAFVGVLEHYQQTICTIHALERGELLPFCNCTDKSQWSRFEGNYTVKKHRPTRPWGNKSDESDDGPIDALIDQLTLLDRKVYAAAIHRLRRDASRVERVYGVRLWCND